MAEYYRASFTVEKSHTAPEERGLGLLEKVVGPVREWAEDRLGEPLGDMLVGDWEKEGATLHIDRGEFDASGFWRLVLEHPDDSKASKWRTDFV